MKKSYVYILASKKYGTLYVGVTSDLVNRVRNHKQGIVLGFTHKYRVNKLVYFETHNNIKNAITREKRIKKWKRSWKIRLIEDGNSLWEDLYLKLV